MSLPSQSVTGNGKTAHTPWRVVENDSIDGGYSVLDSREAVVADCVPSKELADLIASAPDLSKFKAYVHQRLDDAGIPVDPESPHKAEGCRIGGRLDIVLGTNGIQIVGDLRDYFAASAITGVMAIAQNQSIPDVANAAYKVADAMLARRAKS